MSTIVFHEYHINVLIEYPMKFGLTPNYPGFVIYTGLPISTRLPDLFILLDP